MATTSTTKADVFYPESDGKPMGETIDHRRLFNPATGQRLLNRLERIEREKEARREAETELERLRQELEALRSGRNPGSKPKKRK